MRCPTPKGILGSPSVESHSICETYLLHLLLVGSIRHAGGLLVGVHCVTTPLSKEEAALKGEKCLVFVFPQQVRRPDSCCMHVYATLMINALRRCACRLLRNYAGCSVIAPPTSGSGPTSLGLLISGQFSAARQTVTKRGQLVHTIS